MEALLLTREYVCADPAEYDLRYFYFDTSPNRLGHSTCGMAFGTLLAIYRHTKRNLSYNRYDWYAAISRSPNSTVLGYLVEHMCLSAIARGALNDIVKSLPNRLEKAFFDGTPAVEVLVRSENLCHLYIPTAFDFPDIGGAIIRLDRKERMAYIYPIQITIAKTHTNSKESFYKNQWTAWDERFSTEGYRTSSTFVWVNRQGSSRESAGKNTKSAGKTRKEAVAMSMKTRSTARKTEELMGEVEVAAEHQSIEISIESLDPFIHAAMVKRGFWN